MHRFYIIVLLCLIFVTTASPGLGKSIKKDPLVLYGLKTAEWSVKEGIKQSAKKKISRDIVKNAESEFIKMATDKLLFANKQKKSITIYTNNNLFDKYAKNKKGRTNCEIMLSGQAPIGYDGKKIHIHHIGQVNNGDLLEILASAHEYYYRELHLNTGKTN